MQNVSYYVHHGPIWNWEISPNEASLTRMVLQCFILRPDECCQELALVAGLQLQPESVFDLVVGSPTNRYVEYHMLLKEY